MLLGNNTRVHKVRVSTLLRGLNVRLCTHEGPFQVLEPQGGWNDDDDLVHPSGLRVVFGLEFLSRPNPD